MLFFNYFFAISVGYPNIYYRTEIATAKTVEISIRFQLTDKLEFVCVIYRSMLLNSIFLFLTRFNPSKKTITHTAEPRVAFIITISVSVIPSNDTSIERCNANIETKASAKDMFRSVIRVADELRRAFMSFIVASVI